MAGVTIYQKPTCTTCRKVYQVLKDSGVDFKSVNYYIDPLSKTRLKSLLSKMMMSPTELLRKNEKIYKELKRRKTERTDEEWINLMVKYPDLLQRPIIEIGSSAVLARPAERILDILSRTP